MEQTINESSYKVIGNCPVCDGKIIKTCKGYCCQNSVGENPSCSFFIPGVICNRYLKDDEVKTLLSEKNIPLDGFSNNNKVIFSSILSLSGSSVNINSKVTLCPKCGGDIHIGQKAYNCSNYSNTEHPCNFMIWRSLGGHSVTPDEVREICENGITDKQIEMYREDGTIYRRHIGLSPQKDKIVKF